MYSFPIKQISSSYIDIKVFVTFPIQIFTLLSQKLKVYSTQTLLDNFYWLTCFRKKLMVFYFKTGLKTYTSQIIMDGTNILNDSSDNLVKS